MKCNLTFYTRRKLKSLKKIFSTMTCIVFTKKIQNFHPFFFFPISEIFSLGKEICINFEESWLEKQWRLQKVLPTLVQSCFGNKISHCGNWKFQVKTFVSLRFYVKLILWILEVQKLVNFVHLVDFSLQRVQKIIRIKIQSL